MLLDCLASCTRCLTPRQERRAAHHRDGVPVVPVPVPVHVPILGPMAVVAPETVPGTAQVSAANDDPDSPEPPFQTDLSCTIDRATVTIRVTVDHSVSVNVVTIKCLKGHGRKALRNPLPTELSDSAAMVLPGYREWQQLTLYSPTDHRGLTRDLDLVVVDDDYPCDLLLGAEFKCVSFEPGGGLYPNHAKALDKEERERQERELQELLAREAAAAAERKSKKAKRLEEGNKKDPNSGDGAGEGTSASHTRATAG